MVSVYPALSGHDVANFLGKCLFISLLFLLGRENFTLFCKGMVSFISVLLSMLVAEWEPTPCYRDAYSAGTQIGISGERLADTLLDHIFYFWEVKVWKFHIGMARHPGPGKRLFTPGQLSVEFVNVGGWLTYGNLALDSCAQFLAVAERRLIPSRARSVCHQLRKACHQSVWSPACQDQVAGGHAGVGVVSLGGAPLSLPSFTTPQFKEFFRLGRALRTILRTGKGGVVHLFVVDGIRVRRMIVISFCLLISSYRLFWLMLRLFVLVSLCSLLLFLVLLRVFLLVGLLIWHWFFLVELVLHLMLPVGLILRVVWVRVETLVGCPNALAASDACFVTDRWFTLHFSVFARFRIDAWLADVACPMVCQPVWPACWLDTPDRSSLSSSRVVQDVWDTYRDELGVVPDDAASRSSADDFWSIWSRSAEDGFFRAYFWGWRPH